MKRALEVLAAALPDIGILVFAAVGAYTCVGYLDKKVKEVLSTNVQVVAQKSAPDVFKSESKTKEQTPTSVIKTSERKEEPVWKITQEAYQ